MSSSFVHTLSLIADRRAKRRDFPFFDKHLSTRRPAKE